MCGRLRETANTPGEYSMLEADIYLAGVSGVTPTRPNPPSFDLVQSYGSLEVSVRTSGTLYLDGKSMGRIPTGSRAKLTDIPTGRHNLEMRYRGKRESKTITVQENLSLAVAFNWAERPNTPEGYVLVEEGTFRMGSTGGDSDEKPEHGVTVGSFYMKETELTQGEWRAVMGNNPSRFKGDNLPVENVSWYDAVKYCNALSKKEGRTPVYQINGNNVTANWSADGYRLPTEAEWEVRGPRKKEIPGG